MPDNWTTIATNTPDVPPTDLAALLNLIEENKRLPQPEFDCVVATHAGAARLQAACLGDELKRDDFLNTGGEIWTFPRLGWVPVWIEKDRAAAYARAFELAVLYGRKPALVDDESESAPVSVPRHE